MPVAVCVVQSLMTQCLDSRWSYTQTHQHLCVHGRQRIMHRMWQWLNIAASSNKRTQEK